MPVSGVLLSLWRAVTLLRVVTLVFCLYLIFRWRDIYAHPLVAYLVGAAMVVVTATVGWLAVRGRAHRPLVVGIDLAATALLTLASIWAQTTSQRTESGMPTLTTIWAAGPVIEVAFLAGGVGGLLAALVQFGAALAVRSEFGDGRTLTSGFLLAVAGATTGYVATLVVRAEHDLATATAERAALRERERLARSVHDGVLQVLALVHRNGRDEDGPWRRIAAEAAAQETALRGLLAAPVTSADVADLGAALRLLGGDRVTVSVPADAVALDEHVTSELAAAVSAALDNVTRHAGEGSRAWVLLEDLDDGVEITVRDDGCGFVPGRLAAAAADRRLGVAQSIRGRLADLGGSAEIDSEPGSGTTVRLRVPA